MLKSNRKSVIAGIVLIVLITMICYNQSFRNLIAVQDLSPVIQFIIISHTNCLKI
jgi:hypothetical protein